MVMFLVIGGDLLQHFALNAKMQLMIIPTQQNTWKVCPQAISKLKRYFFSVIFCVIFWPKSILNYENVIFCVIL